MSLPRAVLAAVLCTVSCLVTAGPAAAGPLTSAYADPGAQVPVVLALAPPDAGALHDAAVAVGGSAAERRRAVTALTPSDTARQAVVTFLEAAGLRVDAVSDWDVAATGDAATVARVFGTRLLRAPDGFRPAGPVVVPPALAGIVSGVFGLDTTPLLRPSAIPLGYKPSELRDAYDAPSGGSGQGLVVATMQFSGWNVNDLLTYADAAGITMMPGQVYQESVNGGSITTPAAGGDFEVALDQEVILAAAPEAFQRIYFGTNGAAGAVAVYNRIADQAVAGLIDVVSISWGACEPAWGTGPTRDTLNNALARMLAAGATVFAASGDGGAYDCTQPGAPNNTVAVAFPASSPYAVAVGGTTLTKDGGDWTEVAWNTPTGTSDPAAYQGQASGGGQSLHYGRPAYQNGLPFAGSKRLVPDVSSLADPIEGIGIYWNKAPGGWLYGGGTSAGAPLWAGFLAATLSTEGRTDGIGAIHQTLYSNPQGFRDVTSGTNFVFAAGPGYDQVTGLGSPQWGTLADHVLAIPLGTFFPLSPARLLDTRDAANGGPVPLGAEDPRPLQVAGRGGVPANGAAAVLLNVTALSATAATHVAVYPGGPGGPPEVSNLNVVPKQVVPNLVAVKLGTNGTVNLRNFAGTVHAVADVVGWYSDGTTKTGSVFRPLTPARVLDTRFAIGAPKARIAAGKFIDLDITGVGGVPATGIGAVTINVTVTQPSASGYLTVYPTSGAAPPLASNLNFVPNQTVANLVTAKVGSGGKIRFFNSAGNTHVVADVVGWFTDGTASTGARFHGVAPERILDTRDGTGTGGQVFTLGQEEIIDAQLAGAGPIPPVGVTAVVLNVTATQGTKASYLTVYPSTSAPRPEASNLNFGPNKNVPNLVVVKLGDQGRVRFFNSVGAVHVVADVVGYYR